MTVARLLKPSASCLIIFSVTKLTRQSAKRLRSFPQKGARKSRDWPKPVMRFQSEDHWECAGFSAGVKPRKIAKISLKKFAKMLQYRSQCRRIRKSARQSPIKLVKLIKLSDLNWSPRKFVLNLNRRKNQSYHKEIKILQIGTIRHFLAANPIFLHF